MQTFVEDMMGRGDDRGCGTEEKPCKISTFRKNQHQSLLGLVVDPPEDVKIDYYNQAQKALCERSPFEDEAEVSRVCNIPSGLADFLSRSTYSRKKHKKSHSESSAGQKKSSSSVEKSKVKKNIWSDTEDYFRQVTFTDIQNLVSQSSSVTSSQPFFTIPSLPKFVNENVDSSAATVSGSNEVVVEEEEVVVPKEEVVVENKEKQVEEDNLVENEVREAEILPTEEKEDNLVENEPLITQSSSSSSNGLEWLLGARNKVVITSERPSKKRKLLGSEAGLDRLKVVCPSVGQSLPVCHLCCLEDTCEHMNSLLVCGSCKVYVHQKCYGVQDVPVGIWLCSWCLSRGSSEADGDGKELSSRPCILCPKSGGALKPVVRNVEFKGGGSSEFAHLFCSLWMPDAYVEDIKKMEPIMNIGEINDMRKKLVCNVCKVKYGACVRCSHGTCRTALHPICAREAKYKMEIWGKIGCDNVELRAFCAKHSGLPDVCNSQQSVNNTYAGDDCGSSISSRPTVLLVVNKSQKVKLGQRSDLNDQINGVRVTATDTNSENLVNNEISLGQDLSTTRPSSKPRSECDEGLDSKDTSERGNVGETNLSDSLDIVQTLKKLVDRGKVIVSDVASDIGISSDTLAEILVGGNSIFPDLRCKIIKWIRNHAYVDSPQPNLKVGGPDCPDTVSEAGPDSSTDVPFKSVPPRRRTKNNIRILMDNKVVCSSEEKLLLQNGNGIVIDEAEVKFDVPNGGVRDDDGGNSVVSHDGDCCFEDNDVLKEILVESSGLHGLDSSMGQSTVPEGKPVHCNMPVNEQVERDSSLQSSLVNSDGEHNATSVDVGTLVIPDFTAGVPTSCSYVHPFIRNKLSQQAHTVSGTHETMVKDVPVTESPFPGTHGDDDQDGNSTCITADCTLDGITLKKLEMAKKMGVLDLSPEDELEGQLIYLQNKLLDNTIASKRHSDELVSRVVKSLPKELDTACRQRWDLVLVSQYLCGIREAKKQGRKERRNKEAQAVLAAATAAAAASSRISSLRKDVPEETAHHESQSKINAVGGRTGLYSQMMPRAKETLSRLAVGRNSTEKPSETVQLNSSKEHPHSCEICRRPGMLLNPILVCHNCKVPVHSGCYRSVKGSSGPWYCELCEDLMASRSLRVPVVNPREKPCFPAQCCLCGGSSGAFRRSTDGQWVHSFCAEWLLESTFKRGQQNPVEGLDTLLKEREVCSICGTKLGVCVKCHYGNCQSNFHPCCARNAGFYMLMKTGGGGNKSHHKAYCEKHSLELREKAGTQQHGAEELKSIKQTRVELERVRLLCERIIKREKLKRELVVCSQEILASKRDSIALSVLVRSPFFLPDVSSESATTSLRGHVDDKKSCNEATQRSDDITMDTAVSGKRRIMLPAPMDIDQKTDDSSTSQDQMCTIKTNDRVLLSGKKLPKRPASVSLRNLEEDADKRSKSRKHTETFQKELVMTSDQASFQNQRLPKGFAYVPVVCLPKEKPPPRETDLQDSVEPDG
ncbi:hypothetical protein MKW92_007876 [Papaver armeniacum]|nr:hypothetical protein MKW92_007876 [Papaver armeniacum]